MTEIETHRNLKQLKCNFLRALFFVGVYLFGIWVAGFHTAHAESPFPKKSLEDHGEQGQTGGGGTRRPGGSGGGSGQRNCNVDPLELAEFANGETFHFEALTTYLSEPSCQSYSRQVAREAMEYGVRFSVDGPLRLGNFASTLISSNLESSRRTEMALKNTVPALLRQESIGSEKMLPLLGQLALLSPGAAKVMLAEILRRELVAGDIKLNSSSLADQDTISRELASSLVSLGATKREIASAFAESVEEMALMAQADSLGKVFKALSAATRVDASLAGTVNLSAGAFNRGVQRGMSLFGKQDRDALMAAAYESVRAALKGGSTLSVAGAELNEALTALLGESPLDRTALKRSWKDIIRFLGAAEGQQALADAVALSLTPEIVFLLPQDREALLGAARNYPEIAAKVQEAFLTSWENAWTQVSQGSLSLPEWRQLKGKYFQPLVISLLELDPFSLNAQWLKAAVRFGLIPDEQIEKRFPRYVLSLIERRNEGLKKRDTESGLEPVMASMAENMAILWTLGNVHVPALMDWVKKHE